MRFFKFSLLVSLLTVTVSTYNPLSAEEGWHLAYETNGIDVYRRVTGSSKFLEFKATGNLRGAMSEYVSAIFESGGIRGVISAAMRPAKTTVR